MAKPVAGKLGQEHEIPRAIYPSWRLEWFGLVVPEPVRYNPWPMDGMKIGELTLIGR
jgi:hypothetical protein